MDAPAMLNVDHTALARVCAHYHVTELSLFGSAARGTLFTLVDLQTELSEVLGRRVDLVPKAGLKPALKLEVLAEARVLYAA